MAGASGTKILKPPKVSTISGETQSFLPPGWVCSCCHLGTYPIVLCANTPSHSPLPFPDTQRDPWRLCRGWAPTASQLTVGKRGRLKQPQRPRRPPPPTTMSDPHRPCSPAFPGNTTLYTKGWALGRGASLQMPLNPCSSRSDPGVQERARQKLTERRDQGPLPEARAEGKGAQRATSSSRWWPSVCAWSPHARVCPQLGLPKL